MSATLGTGSAALQKFLAAGRALHRYWTIFGLQQWPTICGNFDTHAEWHIYVGFPVGSIGIEELQSQGLGKP